MPRRTRATAALCRLLAGSAAFLCHSGTSLAQQAPDVPLPRTTMGTIGLIEMPSARMAPDGTLSFGASYMKDTQHYDLGFQALPWLETSFRYSGLSHFDSQYPVYWDRSFGAKVRLFEEGGVMPAIALGVNDLIGTGIYSGEYLVASKQFGDFDATLGMGWGRLGSSNTFANPIGEIFSSFKTPRGLSAAGGTPFGTFFHGPTAGVFGGVNWRTPIEGLTLSVENSSDAYLLERQRNGFMPHSSWNYGLSYQASDSISLNLSYLYGASFSAGLMFELDPTRAQFPFRIGEQVPRPVIRTQQAQENALRILVGQQDPDYATSQVQSETSKAFVDELVAIRNVGDVAMTGRTLVVTMASAGNAQILCHTVSNAAAGSGTSISEVTVRGGAGGTQARCAVPHIVQAAEHFADFVHTTPLQLHGLQPITIDATDVQPPVDRRAAERKFRADAKMQGIEIAALSFTATEATVYYVNYRYRLESDAIERLTRLLMADAPTSIEKFRLISVQSGIPQQEYRLLRTPLERAMNDDTGDATVFDSPVTVQSPALSNPILSAQTRKNYPHFNWDIFPQLRQQFFDPNNPLGLQVVGVLQVGVDLAPGLSIWAQGEGSIVDTFNTNRQSNSVLPHVRSDFVRYFSDGKNGLAAAQINYRTRLTPEFYATLRGGYLESMFMGGGGEVLYRPDGARWAIGADLYEVWQRNFDRLFGLQPYHVTTGHVTLYWDSPFYDLNFQVRAGQYLAGDRGLTLQISRRFASGVEIGAFVTKTNVSSQQFGEGSFDKGVIIRIPLDWIAPINTQNRVAMDLRPVQRDGGQPLLGDATLYEETQRTSEGELYRGGAFPSP